MDTTKTDIARAGRAQEIIDNPEFMEAYNDIEKDIVNRWKISKIHDEEGHKYLKIMLKIHTDYLSLLKTRIRSGKVAEVKVTNMDRQNKIAGIFRS